MECRWPPKNISGGTSPFTGSVILLGSVMTWMRTRKSLCCYNDLWRPSLTAREVPHAEIGSWGRSLGGHPGVVKLWNGLRQISLITLTLIFYIIRCRHVCVSQLLCLGEVSFPAKYQRNFYSHCFSLFLTGFKWHFLFLLQDGFCLPSPPFPKIWFVFYPTLKQSLIFILWAILRSYFLLSCGWTVDCCVAVRGVLE